MFVLTLDILCDHSHISDQTSTSPTESSTFSFSPVVRLVGNGFTPDIKEDAPGALRGMKSTSYEVKCTTAGARVVQWGPNGRE